MSSFLLDCFGEISLQYNENKILCESANKIYLHCGNIDIFISREDFKFTETLSINSSCSYVKRTPENEKDIISSYRTTI